MTDVQIAAGRLHLEVKGWHKLWALRGSLDVVLGHIVSVARLDKPRWLGGIRLGGTALPGAIKAGRYWRNGQWEFWDVCKMENAIVLDLVDEEFSKVVVEVADPAEAIAEIQASRLPVATS